MIEEPVADGVVVVVRESPAVVAAANVIGTTGGDSAEPVVAAVAAVAEAVAVAVAVAVAFFISLFTFPLGELAGLFLVISEDTFHEICMFVYVLFTVYFNEIGEYFSDFFQIFEQTILTNVHTFDCFYLIKMKVEPLRVTMIVVFHTIEVYIDGNYFS